MSYICMEHPFLMFLDHTQRRATVGRTKTSSYIYQHVAAPPVELLPVDCVWNVMAHAQKPDFVFRRNGRVNLNRQGNQFTRLLAAEVLRNSGSNAGYTMLRGSVKYRIPTPFAGFPLLPLPCVTVCHHFSTGLYVAAPQWLPSICPCRDVGMLQNVFSCGSWWNKENSFQKYLLLSIWMIVTVWPAVQNTEDDVKTGFAGCLCMGLNRNMLRRWKNIEA